MVHLKSRASWALAAAWAVGMFLAGGRPAQADLPPITAEQKALTAVLGEPKAPAVVLFHQGEVHFLDLGRHGHESKFTVRRRVKILSEEGRSYGDLVLSNWQAVRIKKLEGRTVLPDGRELPLKTVFHQNTSHKGFGVTTTVATFDGVEVGAILDFEYVVRFESIFSLRPWFFQENIPTLYSEVVYIMPHFLGFRPWGTQSSPGQLHQELTNGISDRILRAWMVNLPSLPAEPFSPPQLDLTSKLMIVITSIAGVPLFETWESTCELFVSDYGKKRRKGKKAESLARELVAGVAGQRQQAEKIYRFVRDEIHYDPVSPWDKTVNAVVEDGRGDSTDQALLLQVMLQEVGLDSDLVWTEHRAQGRVDMKMPYPGWFGDRLVQVTIDGQTFFLNPADRRLSFGQLAPGHQDMDALIVSSKTPQPLILPGSTSSDNQRQARLDLTVDDRGRLAGSGALSLTGYHAYEQFDWRATPEQTSKAWQEWLQEALADFSVSEVRVEESVDERRAVVRWAMAQLPETVLPGEINLQPSRPLGPVESPFKAPGRVTPVLLPVAEIAEVELVLRWGSEGSASGDWQVDAQPGEVAFDGSIGSFTAGVELGKDGRSAVYRRRLEVSQREFFGAKPFVSVQQLYQVAEAHDQQRLVLVRRQELAMPAGAD